MEVNGPDAHPVFKYLKENTDAQELNWNFSKSFYIKKCLLCKANYACFVDKYLVVDGKVVKHYLVNIRPFEIEDDILSYFNSEL